MARGKKTGLPEPSEVDQASGERDPGGRLARADHLIAAIAACDWRDAEVILSAFLEEYRLGPPLPALLDIKEEAAFWASLATQDELMAWFTACGRKLVERQFGFRGRVRLAARALAGLALSDRERALAELAKPGSGDSSRDPSTSVSPPG